MEEYYLYFNQNHLFFQPDFTIIHYPPSQRLSLPPKVIAKLRRKRRQQRQRRQLQKLQHPQSPRHQLQHQQQPLHQQLQHKQQPHHQLPALQQQAGQQIALPSIELLELKTMIRQIIRSELISMRAETTTTAVATPTTANIATEAAPTPTVKPEEILN